MLTPKYHPVEPVDHGVTRRRVVLGLGAAFVIAAVVGMTQTEVGFAGRDARTPVGRLLCQEAVRAPTRAEHNAALHPLTRRNRGGCSGKSVRPG